LLRKKKKKKIKIKIKLIRVELVHLSLYDLNQTTTQSFFRWKEDICKWIEEYWDKLTPTKPKTPTWENTVASVLCSNTDRFDSILFN